MKMGEKVATRIYRHRVEQTITRRVLSVAVVVDCSQASLSCLYNTHHALDLIRTLHTD
jgi:predicted amino acid-binding ACT domain protein